MNDRNPSVDMIVVSGDCGEPCKRFMHLKKPARNRHGRGGSDWPSEEEGVKGNGLSAGSQGPSHNRTAFRSGDATSLAEQKAGGFAGMRRHYLILFIAIRAGVFNFFV
jgi:hypothetical protein